MRLSKKVRQGMFVTRHGNWIVPCNDGETPIGVWEEGHDRTTRTLQWEKIVTPQPRGIVTRGQTSVPVYKVGEIVDA